MLGTVEVLAATAITGILQSLLGGQPLLIVGVAEPTILVYMYMYDFAVGQDGEGCRRMPAVWRCIGRLGSDYMLCAWRHQALAHFPLPPIVLEYTMYNTRHFSPSPTNTGLGPGLFVAWAAWTCVFAGIMIVVLALSNACGYITRFTRFAGELFGALIAMLFLQQAIKGLVHECKGPEAGTGEATAASEYSWRLVNGTWSLFLAFGLLLTSLKVRRARRWRFLNAQLRALLEDYGVPLMVVAWSALSFAMTGAPKGVPTRADAPNPWDVRGAWDVSSVSCRKSAACTARPCFY